MSEQKKSDLINSLNALLLPLADRRLLVPNVALIELVDFIQPKLRPNLPSWFLGSIFWRNLNVPLLSFELASGGELKISKKYKIAILNAIGGNPNRKFIAILLSGIPSPVKITSDLESLQLTPEPLEHMAVKVGDLNASIPDLVKLEQRLDSLNLDI